MPLIRNGSHRLPREISLAHNTTASTVDTKIPVCGLGVASESSMRLSRKMQKPNGLGYRAFSSQISNRPQSNIRSPLPPPDPTVRMIMYTRRASAQPIASSTISSGQCLCSAEYTLGTAMRTPSQKLTMYPWKAREHIGIHHPSKL